MATQTVTDMAAAAATVAEAAVVTVVEAIGCPTLAKV
jgi:hypothetical protein